MKKFLRNIKLKSKIMVLAGIPTLGLLIFSAMIVYQNFQTQREASHFSELVDIVLEASEVAHEVQKERDISILYIANKGTIYAQQLIAQHKLTDNRIRAFESYIEGIERGAFGEKLRESIEQALSELRGLTAKRAQINSLSSGIDETMPFYREVIESLASFDNEFILRSPNSDISQVASSFSIYMQLKEYYSRERAELTYAFKKDGFRAGMHIKLLNLMNAEENALSEFEHVAIKKHINLLDSKMQHPAIHELNNLRSIAVEKATVGRFGVDSLQWFKLASERHEILGEIEHVLADDIHHYVDELSASSRWGLLASIIAVLVMVSLTLTSAMMVAHAIVAPVNRAVEVADQIASGDLRAINVSNNKHADEVGLLLQALRAMQAKLTEVIRSSKEAATVVKKGAEEIRFGNVNLSERTEQQAANLQETTSSMEEMAGTVRQNADNAKQANQLAKAARGQAEQGGEVVGRAVYAMNKINDSSKKIADIIGVIDEIAFQTNLLALNAAVEAARAGEQGRGFAVVATEVRNLAGRSATAAKEIKGLIEDSVDKVDEGSKLVNSSGQMLNEIVQSVKKVSDIIAEIASAGQEQSTGIDQVSLAVSQMDELTQQNASMVQESAEASATMGSEANMLQNILEFFIVEGESNSRGSAMSGDRNRTISEKHKVSPVTRSIPKPMNKPPVSSSVATGKTGTTNAQDEWESF